MRAIIIANHADADGGVVAERLGELGWELSLWNREDARDWSHLPEDIGLVVPLGSDWSVYWEDVAAFVAGEARVLRDAHERGTPIFGICFGAQMLAHALGGRVERAATPEIGWYPVAADRENGSIFGQNPWFQWHYDRFIPPPGATELAVGPQGCQAFLLGSSLGVQFHPEITPTIVERWSSGPGAEELARIGRQPSVLAAETDSHAHVSASAARRLVDWFIEHCVTVL